LIEEALAVNDTTGNTPLRYASLVLAAWRGHEASVRELRTDSIQDARTRGEGRAIAWAEYATAVLNNGTGGYATALAAAQRACEHDDLGLLNWALPELVEASVRSGRLDLAATALRRLEERTRASEAAWARGIEASRHRGRLPRLGERRRRGGPPLSRGG
jgi:hypothetical protein